MQKAALFLVALYRVGQAIKIKTSYSQIMQVSDDLGVAWIIYQICRLIGILVQVYQDPAPAMDVGVFEITFADCKPGRFDPGAEILN